MKKYWIKILLGVCVVIAAGAFYKTAARIATFEELKAHRQMLSAFVDSHYLLALLLLASAFFSTAFFLPGALVLTIGSGFLFGAGAGALYANLFLTAGSVLAFLASRHLIGNALQHRFKDELIRFNHEIVQHGRHYLFVLRILPILPAFVINYLSGMTRMPVSRFAIVTFVGMLPGAMVYSFAGGQLASIESAKDLISHNVLAGLGLMAALALVPVAVARIRQQKEIKKPRPRPGL